MGATPRKWSDHCRVHGIFVAFCSNEMRSDVDEWTKQKEEALTMNKIWQVQNSLGSFPIPKEEFAVSIATGKVLPIGTDRHLTSVTSNRVSRELLFALQGKLIGSLEHCNMVI